MQNREHTGIVSHAEIAKAPHFPGDSCFPLSRPQLRILRTEEMFPGTPAATLLFKFVLPFDVEPSTLSACMNIAACEFDALRLRLVVDDGRVRQRLFPHVAREYPHLDFSRESEVHEREWLREQAARPFAVSESALYRFWSVRYADQRCGFVLALHHLVSDAATLKLVSDRIGELCRDHAAGLRIEACERPSYLEYLAAETEYLASSRAEKDRSFWLEAFSDPPDPLNFNRREGSGRSIRASRLKFSLDRVCTVRLRDLAEALASSTYVLLFAVLTSYLSRLRERRRFVMGTVTHNRTNRHDKATAGMYINTLALVVDVEGDSGVAPHCRRLTRQLAQLYRHQKYPFDELSHELRAREVDLPYLVDVVFSYENMSFDLENEWIFSGHEYFPFVVHATEREGSDAIQFELDYREELFRPSEVRGFVDGFLAILDAALLEPERPIRELALVSPREHERLVYGLNQTERGYPADSTLHALFEQWRRSTPESTAIAAFGRYLSYKEVDAAAQAIAAALISHGVEPGARVALFAERGAELVLAVLGILKAGGAYVPIDPELPAKRLRHVLEDTGARVLLLDSPRFDAAKAPGVAALAIRDLLQTPVAEPPSWPEVSATAEACVLYTSGSTGLPKGSALSHRNIVRLVRENGFLAIQPSDRVLQFSNYAFDGSLFDMFGALTNGAGLVLSRKETFLNMAELGGLLRGERVSVALITTAMLNTLIDVDVHCLDGVRALLFGGERVSKRHIGRLREVLGPGRIIHCYGPTENGVCTTTYTVPASDHEAGDFPIGKPLANTQVYVLDSNQRVLPVGAVGELCTSGDGLVRGYLNQPELTARRFLPHPFLAGQQLYRTGDLVRMYEDGNIVFVGREDRQVKRRGFRIELDAVERELATHPRIEQSIVTLVEQREAERALCAYYVATAPIPTAELRAHLLRELPLHALPDHFVHLQALPLTSNGKVDTRALPPPVEQGKHPQGALPANLSERERGLLAIWERVLGYQPESVEQSFFDAGGNSIKLLEVHALLDKAYPGRVQVADLFAHPTIDTLAEFIRVTEQQRPGVELVTFEACPRGAARTVSSLRVQLGGARLRETAAASAARDTSIDVALAAAFALTLSAVLGRSQVPLLCEASRSEAFRLLTPELAAVADASSLDAAFRQANTHARDYSVSEVEELTRQQSSRVLPAFLRAGSPRSPSARLLGLCVQLRLSSDNALLQCDYDEARLARSSLQGLLTDYVRTIDSLNRGAPTARHADTNHSRME